MGEQNAEDRAFAWELTRKSPDSALAVFVGNTNERIEDREGKHLTLQMHGLLVSGELIPAWLWAKLHQDALEASRGEPVPDSVYVVWSEEEKEQRRKSAAISDTEWEELTEEEKKVQVFADAAAHIHLRGARILSGAGLVPTKGSTLWRGRLASVDGWFEGALGD